MRRRDEPHTHPCAICKAPAPCSGSYERNYDGWPEAICTDYHLDGGFLAPVYCETHEGIECETCGEFHDADTPPCEETL